MFSNPGFLRVLVLLAGMGLPVSAHELRAEEPASFTVDARLVEGAVSGLQAHLRCGGGAAGAQQAIRNAWLPKDGTVVFDVPVPATEDWTCTVVADVPPGLEVGYRGDGGSAVDVAGDGCHFSGIRAGHANFCQIQARGQATSITVYKKWIGARSREPDVRIELVCGGRAVAGSRDINAGKPGGWSLDLTDPEGTVCDVLEIGSEAFVSDTSDCRGLLFQPGSEEECTMVNTKVVKMIEMLNRYGLAIMILVFMAAGMIAARRFVP